MENLEVNLKGLVDSSQDIGVPGGDKLLEFSEALIGNDSKRLNNARLDLEKQLGPDAIPAASAIAANFSKNDRIANGCGIPVDDIMLKATTDIREELNLDSFRSAANTFRHL